LFRAVKDGHLNDEQHLAEMVSLMGPPPRSFLERSETSRQYWDAEGKVIPQPAERNISLTGNKGNWIASTPIPHQTLELRENRLKGKDQELLLALVRKILRWLPEDRPLAENLFDDEFLVAQS
jgi:hypothetical protein